MAKKAKMLLAALFFCISSAAVAKARDPIYISAGASDEGLGLSAGVSALPPVVIMPGFDIGIDYDVVGDTEGAFVTAQIGFGVPFVYGYAEYGVGKMWGTSKNSEGAKENQSDGARKITLGMALGAYLFEVIYEHVRWYSFVDSSAHLLGLRFRF